MAQSAQICVVTESSLLIAVGDVTGHGIAAALLMATARAALRVSAVSLKGVRTTQYLDKCHLFRPENRTKTDIAITHFSDKAYERFSTAFQCRFAAQ